jgi:hypothetical protein
MLSWKIFSTLCDGARSLLMRSQKGGMSGGSGTKSEWVLDGVSQMNMQSICRVTYLNSGTGRRGTMGPHHLLGCLL